MQTVLNENKGIAYEAFLLLSLFIMMPHQEGSKTTTILVNNQKMLFDFIGNFQPERDDDEFFGLKNRMREALQDL